jgi:hypothetical protein
VSKFKLVIISASTGAFIFALGLSPLPLAQAGSPINLGSAGNYQILSGSAITVGAGSIGVDPAADGVSSSAVADLASAISAASGLSGTTISADLGGITYTPGVYLSPGGAAFAMTGNVVLSGAGSFIFYTPAAINITAGVVTMLNGATAANVYWIAGGAITIGASTSLQGIFMSSAAITTGASNTFTGCLLAAAAVTMGASNILNPCPLTSGVVPTGNLSISAPGDCLIPDVLAGGMTTAETGDIVVTDSRVGYGVTTWAVSVTASGLSDSSHDEIPPTAIRYSVLGLNNTGGITTTSTNLESLSATTPSAIVSATGAGALNSSTWHAQLKILIPISQPAGSYAGSITHSVY